MKALKKLSICILSGLLCFGIGASTQAAEKIGNGVYRFDTSSPEQGVNTDSMNSFDITGDGKKDKIETKSASNKVVVKVNNKTVGSYLNGPGIYVVKLSKKAFLQITTYEKNHTASCGLYELKGNKLSRVLDYKKLVNLKQYAKNTFYITNGYWSEFEATKTKGNTIYLQGYFGTKNLGQVNAENLQLSYSGKNFTLKSTAASASAFGIYDPKTNFFTNQFTASQKIQTYKAAGSSRKAFTISKNAKFEVKKLAIVKKNIYVQVKSGKKTGWIRLNTSSKKMVKQISVSIAG